MSRTIEEYLENPMLLKEFSIIAQQTYQARINTPEAILCRKRRREYLCDLKSRRSQLDQQKKLWRENRAKENKRESVHDSCFQWETARCAEYLEYIDGRHEDLTFMQYVKKFFQWETARYAEYLEYIDGRHEDLTFMQYIRKWYEDQLEVKNEL